MNQLIKVLPLFFKDDGDFLTTQPRFKIRQISLRGETLTELNIIPRISVSYLEESVWLQTPWNIWRGIKTYFQLQFLSYFSSSFSSVAIRPVFEPWPHFCRGFGTVEFLLDYDVSTTPKPQPWGPRTVEGNFGRGEGPSRTVMIEEEEEE